MCPPTHLPCRASPRNPNNPFVNEANWRRRIVGPGPVWRQSDRKGSDCSDLVPGSRCIWSAAKFQCATTPTRERLGSSLLPLRLRYSAWVDRLCRYAENPPVRHGTPSRQWRPSSRPYRTSGEERNVVLSLLVQVDHRCPPREMRSARVMRRSAELRETSSFRMREKKMYGRTKYYYCSYRYVTVTIDKDEHGEKYINKVSLVAAG
mmetsp:Transcript_7383/g.8123  ORF Transcript_7383/g.8123 Transcript_7383/m.8123 type:complete len:206 (+) Transcript_7383:510-1127(+)